jgi:hypothetical protein
MLKKTRAAGLLAAMLAAPALAAESASGAIECDAAKYPVRGAVARWESSTRKLVLTLFQKSPSPEMVKHWADMPSGEPGQIPQGMEHLARITYTLRGTGKIGHSAIEAYHLHVPCPSLHINLARSAAARPNLKADFPEFEAMLQPGGRLKASVRGAEELRTKTVSKASWDFRVDTRIHLR